VFVEAPAHIVADRLSDRHLDRFERAGNQFHQRVLDGFKAMAAADPERWIVIDTHGPKDVIAADVLRAVQERIDGSLA
jgi:dTMP kinase